MTRREIACSALGDPRGHFSHAVVVDGTVYVSGLLAHGEAGIVAPGDIEQQSRRIYEMLGHILADVGGSLADIVALTNYVTDVSQRAAANTVRAQVLGDARPASTLVEVSALAAPGAVIEIDAIAVVPH